MTSWLCLPLAAALDWAFGDPQFAWHPVRLIGGFTVRVERAVRRRGSSRLHGCLAWTLVVGMAVVCASALLAAARRVHPAAELVVSATLVYFTIAPRDLARHAHRVEGALRSSDLIAARSAVGHPMSDPAGGRLARNTRPLL
ncbi:MAG TPA: cobalamin biosynthesis protein, partial [Polyangiaceae bacterium]